MRTSKLQWVCVRYIQNDMQSFRYMRVLCASGICIVLVRYNATKSYAILRNTKARLHLRLYTMKLHIKTMLYVNVHVQTIYRGTQYLPTAQWGGPIPRILSNIPSCLVQGSQGFQYANPERVVRYKHVERLTYPTAFYLKSEWDSD